MYPTPQSGGQPVTASAVMIEIAFALSSTASSGCPLTDWHLMPSPAIACHDTGRHAVLAGVTVMPCRHVGGVTPTLQRLVRACHDVFGPDAPPPPARAATAGARVATVRSSKEERKDSARFMALPAVTGAEMGGDKRAPPARPLAVIPPCYNGAISHP